MIFTGFIPQRTAKLCSCHTISSQHLRSGWKPWDVGSKRKFYIYSSYCQR